MGIFESKGQANALCTVIALGFIIKSKEKQPNNSYIIFQEGEGREDKKTRDQHCLLQAKLANLAGSKASFTFITQLASNKSNQPIIMAQTSRSVMQGDFSDKERAIFNKLEKEISKYTNENGLDIPLRGAYVGGALLDGAGELLDASVLYGYEPKYREVSEKETNKSYNSASSVSKAVQGFLNSMFKGEQALKYGGTIIRRPDERLLSDIISTKPKGADLFASVHGMTQSIIHYYQTNSPNKVNIELALSKDTCKVASCIPCSIFMWSNGTPATATHFGRGDNWNFPSNVFKLIQKCSSSDYLTTLAGYPYAIDWMEHVWTSYEAGIECFTGKPESWISKDLNDVRFSREKTPQMFEKIPQMFLEALTFEGSFLDKMLSTLESVPG